MYKRKMTPKNSKIIKIVVVSSLLILVITAPLLIRAYRQTRAFGLAFSRYSSAIINGDYHTAYGMADSEFKSATGYAEFADIHQSMLNQFGVIKLMKRGRTVIEGKGDPTDWYAAADAVMHFERGYITLRYSFHMTDGKWRLHGFERIS
jgi:hypothetical protein